MRHPQGESSRLQSRRREYVAVMYPTTRSSEMETCRLWLLLPWAMNLQVSSKPLVKACPVSALGTALHWKWESHATTAERVSGADTTFAPRCVSGAVRSLSRISKERSKNESTTRLSGAICKCGLTRRWHTPACMSNAGSGSRKRLA